MAVRYSGSLKLRITYKDNQRFYASGQPMYPNGYYSVSISGGDEPYRVIVGAPAFLSEAVDSHEAYDDVARAALAFADHEVRGFGDQADFEPDGSGYFVSRKPYGRSPR